MLPVLKEAGVVDSGGQGLLQVLKGAYDAFCGKEVDYTIQKQAAVQKTGAAKAAGPRHQKQISGSVIVPSLLL